MPVTVVAGVQWGDEGKGRIVDLLARDADLVVRCQGGPNAGHTVINDLGRFVLHAIPSGIFSEQTLCIVGAGTVVNPTGIVEEIEGLRKSGIDTGNLLISERAHVIMPYHRLLEALDEQSRSADNKIASTGQGIAPAYSDKAARRGIRVGDLLDMRTLRDRMVDELKFRNRILAAFDRPLITVDEVISQIEPAAQFLKPFIGDTVIPIMDAIQAGKQVMLEGQLGVMRDLDWGAYPFVTSSSPTPAGMAAGAGVPPQCVSRVVGVVKAYTTAVGAGPFPTELTCDKGASLRERGGEYGATTGRPRRCGWFDTVAVAWATKVAGFTELALTKVDILDDEPVLPVCVRYEYEGRTIESFPTTALMGQVKPVYEEMPGWMCDTSSARTMADLPKEAVDYIDVLEKASGAPITLVSVGPERDSIIDRR